MEIVYKDITVKNPRKNDTIYTYLKTNGYSENYLKNLRKQMGFIKLNNQDCIITTLVNENDVISVNVNPNTKTSIYSCIIPLDIVYEDDDILAVNKPSMLPTMPSKSHFKYNLSGAVLNYMENKIPNFVVRIVNRLDKEACGIVLICKNSLASNFLNKEENTKKTYYAFCKGNLTKDSIIDTNILTEINQFGYNSNKRKTSTISGKKAKTYVELVKNFKDYCLVKITLEHGRTHQIRVHLSSINHPLLGDTLYGEKSNLISHTALICKEIEFTHPTTLKTVKLSIPFPSEFNKLNQE